MTRSHPPGRYQPPIALADAGASTLAHLPCTPSAQCTVPLAGGSVHCQALLVWLPFELCMTSAALTCSPVLPQDTILFDVSSNQLTGTIPELPDTLQELGVHSNSLSGALPALPADLLRLKAGNNQLTGDVSSLTLAQLTHALLANNQLTGSLTAELLKAPKLAELDLSGNKLTGECCLLLLTSWCMQACSCS
jgi:hypothetical protein